MDNEQQELEEKIDELTKTLDRMEDEWSEFQTIISRMTVCKLTDPRHPYTAWEIFILQTKREQEKFRAVMKALQNRLEGKETPVSEQVEVDDFPREVLYASSKPSLIEVVDLLKKAGREDEAGLVEVMQAIKVEFEVDAEFGVLARFVLNGLRLVKETP
jgi:hypothetical protein